jgi:AcrR family transcriptional regulator
MTTTDCVRTEPHTHALTDQNGRKTARDRVLTLAEQLILQKGFAATSIEELIAGVGITKGGFFYHFRDKNDLARALLQRYLATNDRILADVFMRADAKGDTPLERLLIGIDNLADVLAEVQRDHPGCLVASFCYQDQLFSRDVVALMEQGNGRWRTLFSDRLADVAQHHALRWPIDMAALADMGIVLIDGGITQARLSHDATILPRQLRLYRTMIANIFAPERKLSPAGS